MSAAYPRTAPRPGSSYSSSQSSSSPTPAMYAPYSPSNPEHSGSRSLLSPVELSSSGGSGYASYSNRHAPSNNAGGAAAAMGYQSMAGRGPTGAQSGFVGSQGISGGGHANSSHPSPSRSVLAPAPAPHSHQPLPKPKKGTLNPGEQVQVGQQTVTIDRYLSEGGYAHVYLTRSATPIVGRNAQYSTQCLKRIAVRDDQGSTSALLKEVEHEINVMKLLTGNPWIVEYLASSVRRMDGPTRNNPTGAQGWEVFILMEFCAGGGIIDLLNKRLQNRLREEEILSIFVDVCEAVAYMHSLKQPLLHRDLKIENILCTPISPSHSSSSADISSFRYKLCDFGSTTYPSDRPPRTKKEIEAQAYDLGRHTTLQYRSPEMVEPLLGLPVGLPSDVWALGVLLYKLCYYTTPFEEHGPLAIVNAKYTFPAYPVYSPMVQHLIASMLVENPAKRPTVFDILKQVHRLRGTVPSRDYKTANSQSVSYPPTPSQQRPTNGNALDFTDSHAQKGSITPSKSNVVPEIQPQRRGRPIRQPLQGFPQKADDSPNGGHRPQESRDLLSRSSSLRTRESPKILSSSPQSMPIYVRDQINQGIQDFKTDVTKSFSTPPKSQPKSAQDLLGSLDSGDAFGVPANKTASEKKATYLLPAATDSDVSLLSAKALSQPTSFGDKFGDSFAPSVETNSLKQTGSLPLKHGEAAHTERSTTNPDDSFEMRYPSIEALLAAEGSRASSSSDNAAAVEDASRSVLKPHKPCVTGDNSALAKFGQHRSSAQAADGHVLPRSNHVTGSAFKNYNATKPTYPNEEKQQILQGYEPIEEPRAEGQESPRLAAKPNTFETNPHFGDRKVSEEQLPMEDLLTGDGDNKEMKEGMRALLPSLPDSASLNSLNAPSDLKRRAPVVAPPKPAALSSISKSASTPPPAEKVKTPPQHRHTVTPDDWPSMQAARSKFSGRPVAPPPKPERLHSKIIRADTLSTKPSQLEISLREESSSSSDNDLPDFVDSPVRPSASRHSTEDRGVTTHDILKQGHVVQSPVTESPLPGSFAPSPLPSSPSPSVGAITSQIATMQGSWRGPQDGKASLGKPKPGPKPQVRARPNSSGLLENSNQTDRPTPSIAKPAAKIPPKLAPNPSQALTESSPQSVSSDPTENKAKSINNLIAQWNQATNVPKQNTPPTSTSVPLGTRRRL